MNDFFANSSADSLDLMVLKQLEHIYGNWELTWDYTENKYKEEENSFAALLNNLIEELDSVTPPDDYHMHEDILAMYLQDKEKWKIHKAGKYWKGGTYKGILEQGGFGADVHNLVLAAAGRIRTAKKFGQYHFDDMDISHKKILADILAIILYHRY